MDGIADMVVPVRMRCATPVSVHMNMPKGDGDPPRRRVERVMVPFVRMPMVIVQMRAAVAMFMWGAQAKLAPRADRNPQAKCHQRDTGKTINRVAKTLSRACAYEPNRETK